MTSNWGRIIVLIMVGEDVLVSFIYAFQGDWKLALYWLCAAGIAAIASTF